MSPIFKKVSTQVVLLSFLTMAFFSFVSMTYGPDGRMQGDCPFSPMGTLLCPPSALPGAVHHISAYQSFINVPMNPGLMALIITLLIVVSTVLIFLYNNILHRPPAFVSYSSPPFTSQDRKIKRWLSLFENSPSR